MEGKVVAKYIKRAGEIANGRKVKLQQNTVRMRPNIASA